MRNSLVIDLERWNSLKSRYFELEAMLDLIVITDGTDSFFVKKNRYTDDELGQRSGSLGEYVKKYSAGLV